MKGKNYEGIIEIEEELTDKIVFESRLSFDSLHMIYKDGIDRNGDHWKNGFNIDKQRREEIRLENNQIRWSMKIPSAPFRFYDSRKSFDKLEPDGNYYKNYYLSINKDEDIFLYEDVFDKKTYFMLKGTEFNFKELMFSSKMKINKDKITKVEPIKYSLLEDNKILVSFKVYYIDHVETIYTEPAYMLVGPTNRLMMINSGVHKRDISDNFDYSIVFENDNDKYKKKAILQMPFRNGNPIVIDKNLWVYLPRIPSTYSSLNCHIEKGDMICAYDNDCNLLWQTSFPLKGLLSDYFVGKDRLIFWGYQTEVGYVDRKQLCIMEVLLSNGATFIYYEPSPNGNELERYTGNNQKGLEYNRYKNQLLINNSGERIELNLKNMKEYTGN